MRCRVSCAPRPILGASLSWGFSPFMDGTGGDGPSVFFSFFFLKIRFDGVSSPAAVGAMAIDGPWPLGVGCVLREGGKGGCPALPLACGAWTFVCGWGVAAASWSAEEATAIPSIRFTPFELFAFVHARSDEEMDREREDGPVSGAVAESIPEKVV